MGFLLVSNVWHQGHKASALDRIGKITLLLGTKASALATVHARVRVHVVSETNDIFVIDMFHLRLLVNIVSFCLFHNICMSLIIERDFKFYFSNYFKV
ncbi:MAG: hypothetical protein RLZZ360_225 [Candidatus Parcubacteria bacterium]